MGEGEGEGEGEERLGLEERLGRRVCRQAQGLAVAYSRRCGLSRPPLRRSAALPPPPAAPPSVKPAARMSDAPPGAIQTRSWKSALDNSTLRKAELAYTQSRR